ncbi:MAG: SIMPL domain-containing protein [Pseudomonadota bacterium]
MHWLHVLLISALFTGAAIAEERERTITVTGRGEVLAMPDMATITLGVTHENRNATEAMSLVSQDVTAILTRLETLGFEGRDLQTANLSLSPTWNSGSYSSGQARKITGYTASNTIRAHVRDLEGIGATLDALFVEGANTFSGLSFGLNEPKPYEDQARARAVEDAMDKARQLAEAAGIALGQVRMINEGGGAVAPQMLEMATVRSADVPIAAGEMTIRNDVTIVFDIAP